MEIRNHLNPVEAAGASGATGAGAQSAPHAAAVSSSVLGSDSASLSQAGSLVAGAMAAPEARMDKVQSVQQALATGAYAVSPEEVAGKLMNQMLGK